MTNIPRHRKVESHPNLAEGVKRVDELKALGYKTAERLYRISGKPAVRIYYWM